MADAEHPFSELPAALVQEMLERTEQISDALLTSFNMIAGRRAELKQQLHDAGLVHHESNLPLVPVPTCSGIDGALAIERMLSIDLAAAAAVAVEGLTPPSEDRYWPEPRHKIFVETEEHNADTGTILRGVMIGMELTLACSAPHQVVILDGSLTTPTIFFSQSFGAIDPTCSSCSGQTLTESAEAYLSSYRLILATSRSDRYWLAMPKYTTRREIGDMLGWSAIQDDRGLLSLVLAPGEYTTPLPLTQPSEPWHIGVGKVSTTATSTALKHLADEIANLLHTVQIVYYRPSASLPALRLEMGKATASNPGRLSAVIAAIKHQCPSAAIMEPYPLYLADRMVKHLASSVPAFRQITSQRLSETYKGDISDVFMSLHGYRTESTR